MGRPAISNIETGKTSGIDFEVLDKLATALGVNAAMLIVHESTSLPKSAAKEYLLAPSQQGRRAADPWRFFFQGDEFYAASQSQLAAAQVKISFHRNGKWQLRAGHVVHKFTTNTFATQNWLQCVSLRWLLWPGALQPIGQTSDRIDLLEVPEEKQLIVHLLSSVGKPAPEAPAPEHLGTELWRCRLRDGRSVLLQHQIVEQTEQDRQEAIRVRREAPTIKRPQKGPFYAELPWFMVRPGLGNFVTVVPLGPEAFV